MTATLKGPLLSDQSVLWKLCRSLSSATAHTTYLEATHNFLPKGSVLGSLQTLT
jgi:hypothetical protein